MLDDDKNADDKNTEWETKSEDKTGIKTSDEIESHADVGAAVNSGINVDVEADTNVDIKKNTQTDIEPELHTAIPLSPTASVNHTHKPAPKHANKPDNLFKRMWHAFYNSAVYEGGFLRRNHWDFAVVFWMPLAVILFFWWVFSRPFIVDLPIGVIDDSHSTYSHTLTRYLDASPDINVTDVFQSPAAAQDALLRQQIYAILIIPPDFASNINHGVAAPVILKVNAQFSSHSGIIQRGVQSSVGTFSAGVEIKRTIKQGVNPSQAKINYSPIAIQRISLFNAGSNYQQFLASTILPALLHILAMVIGATTVGREIRDRTFYQWCQAMYADTAALAAHPPLLSASTLPSHSNPLIMLPVLANQQFLPAPKLPAIKRLAPPQDLQTKLQVPDYRPSMAEYIAGLHGKFLWAILAYTLWGALVLTLAIQFSPVGLGAWFMTFIAYLLLLFLSLWLGAIFSLGSYSLRTGLSLTGFISAPSFAFAGVAYPYVAISDSAKHWADALPLTHYLKLQIGLLQMSAPVGTYRSIINGLTISTVICLLLMALLCRRAFAHPERWGGR